MDFVKHSKFKHVFCSRIDSHALQMPPLLRTTAALFQQMGLKLSTLKLDLHKCLCRGVVQAALHSAASPNSEVSTAACEALAEAFERCPDQLLTHMQPQILELTVFALDSSRVLTEDHQYQLLALVSTYVQSSADSLVAGGRSDLIQKLFAAASVHAQNGVGNMAAAHAVDALVATGRAMQVAVKEEMGSGALPAHLQGLLQVCCEGLVGLLQVLQVCLLQTAQMYRQLLAVCVFAWQAAVVEQLSRCVHCIVHKG